MTVASGIFFVTEILKKPTAYGKIFSIWFQLLFSNLFSGWDAFIQWAIEHIRSLRSSSEGMTDPDVSCSNEMEMSDGHSQAQQPPVPGAAALDSAGLQDVITGSENNGLSAHVRLNEIHTIPEEDSSQRNGGRQEASANSSLENNEERAYQTKTLAQEVVCEKTTTILVSSACDSDEMSSSAQTVRRDEIVVIASEVWMKNIDIFLQFKRQCLLHVLSSLGKWGHNTKVMIIGE